MVNVAYSEVITKILDILEHMEKISTINMVDIFMLGKKYY